MTKLFSWYEYAPEDCPEYHLDVAGPNMDVGMCGKCGWPCGVRRPWGESFGWHTDDCSLPMEHLGYCGGGGKGHVMPEGWKLRG